MEHWDLIAKDLTGEISEQEKLQLNDWINKSPENNKIYQESKSTWELTTNKATYNPNLDNAWNKVNKKITTPVVNITKPKQKINLITIAAIFIGVVTVGTLLNNMFNTENYKTFTASNKTEHFTLKDGTQIWLNKNSELKLKENFNQTNRKVLLNGEAFFEVTKNKNKPFIISTQLSTTTVLGTSFNIKGYNDDKENTLSVKTGKVEFKNSKQKEIFIAGQKGSLTKTTIKKTTGNINDFAWQKGIFTFQNTSLKTIANQLEENYKITITFKNKSIENCLFTGDLSTVNLKQNLETISLTNNLDFLHVDDKVMLTGEGC